MQFPEFFDAAPRLTVRDSLARFLGAAEDDVIEYAYTDVVKLAGQLVPDRRVGVPADTSCARSALFGPAPRARGHSG